MATRRRHFGSVRRLPSGRYQASYWHLAMRHVADKTFTAKGEAQAWLSNVETDIQRGAWVDPAGGKITIADLAGRWLQSDPGKRSNTKVRDEMAIRLYIVPTMGPREVGRVTPRGRSGPGQHLGQVSSRRVRPKGLRRAPSGVHRRRIRLVGPVSMSKDQASGRRADAAPPAIPGRRCQARRRRGGA